MDAHIIPALLFFPSVNIVVFFWGIWLFHSFYFISLFLFPLLLLITLTAAEESGKPLLCILLCVSVLLFVMFILTYPVTALALFHLNFLLISVFFPIQAALYLLNESEIQIKLSLLFIIPVAFISGSANTRQMASILVCVNFEEYCRMCMCVAALDLLVLWV